ETAIGYIKELTPDLPKESFIPLDITEIGKEDVVIKGKICYEHSKFHDINRLNGTEVEIELYKD
ncbi:MAG: hypothetical protein KAS87_06570, partial [Candidatus Omnitrophica bacterium]|nr:hypothetical protein [Candidatus Omnitrophota bacterium]